MELVAKQQQQLYELQQQMTTVVHALLAVSGGQVLLGPVGERAVPTTATTHILGPHHTHSSSAAMRTHAVGSSQVIATPTMMMMTGDVMETKMNNSSSRNAVSTQSRDLQVPETDLCDATHSTVLMMRGTGGRTSAEETPLHLAGESSSSLSSIVMNRHVYSAPVQASSTSNDQRKNFATESIATDTVAMTADDSPLTSANLPSSARSVANLMEESAGADSNCHSGMRDKVDKQLTTTTTPSNDPRGPCSSSSSSRYAPLPTNLVQRAHVEEEDDERAGSHIVFSQEEDDDDDDDEDDDERKEEAEDEEKKEQEMSKGHIYMNANKSSSSSSEGLIFQTVKVPLLGRREKNNVDIAKETAQGCHDGDSKIMIETRQHATDERQSIVIPRALVPMEIRDDSSSSSDDDNDDDYEDNNNGERGRLQKWRHAAESIRPLEGFGSMCSVDDQQYLLEEMPTAWR
jgi:hypothetical protein